MTYAADLPFALLTILLAPYLIPADGPISKQWRRCFPTTKPVVVVHEVECNCSVI